MSSYFSLRIIDDTTGEPITGLTGANIKFRYSPYGIGDVVTGITVAEMGTQGNYVAYGFTIYQDVKLFINDVEQLWAGIQKAGDADNAYLKRDGTNAMTGTLDGGNQFISNVKDPTLGGHVGDRDYNDGRYAQKAAVNTFTAANQFNVSLTMSNGAVIYLDAGGGMNAQNSRIINVPNPSGDQDAANKRWVLAQLNGVVGYMEALGICRLIVGEGTIEGKVYSAWADGMAYLKGITDTFPNTRTTYKIESAGLDTQHITLNDGGLGISVFESKVNVKGIGQNVCLDIESVAAYAVTADTVIIENVTLYYNAPTKTASMSGFIFKDCRFEIVQANSTLNLNNCKFKGNNIAVNTGALGLADCKGIPVYCTKQPNVTGTYKLDYIINPDIE